MCKAELGRALGDKAYEDMVAFDSLITRMGNALLRGDIAAANELKRFTTLRINALVKENMELSAKYLDAIVLEVVIDGAYEGEA